MDNGDKSVEDRADEASGSRAGWPVPFRLTLTPDNASIHS